MARILVIDDAPDLAIIMRMLLERAGHEVITAENGRRGLRRFYEDRPDLVVLDVRMPELDGWETLERLRDLSEVPVLIHSGQQPSQDQLSRLRPGLDGFQQKPARGPELTRTVRELLDSSALAAA
jgi:DNA-binding response OmpR family regulator